MQSPQLLRLASVLERYPKPESSFYEDVRSGLFTKGVPLGPRSVAWPASEVDALIAARVRGATDAEIRQLVRELHQGRSEARP